MQSVDMHACVCAHATQNAFWKGMMQNTDTKEQLARVNNSNNNNNIKWKYRVHFQLLIQNLKMNTNI